MAPSGPIRTLAPWGGSFGIDWSAITQWTDEAGDAATEFGVPIERTLATIAIESAGNPDAVQRNPSNGDSYGLMQIVPYGIGWDGWWHRVRDLALLFESSSQRRVIAALHDPAINIRVGASILRDLKAQHGSWDKASSAFFLGNPDWRGQDTVNGNTGAAYRASLNGLMEEYLADSTPAGINWEPLPRPAMVRAIVNKARDGDGFSRTTSRGPRTIGSCNHITDGDPAGDEIEWYRAFFSVGGERAKDALVDTVIARNGQIGLLNDWEDDNWGGTRAGWANGKTDGLSAVGQAIVAKYPGNQINEVFVSKEHVAKSGQSITDAQMSSSIALSAYVAQRARVRWDTYPKNAAGLIVDPLHTDFAAKACPAEPFISTHYPVLIREVKAILTKHQTGSTNPNPPPPVNEFVGLPAWCPPDYLKTVFPDADPNGAVTKRLIRWIAENNRLPWLVEKRVVEGGSNRNIWAFDIVNILNDGNRVWVEGETL